MWHMFEDAGMHVTCHQADKSDLDGDPQPPTKLRNIGMMPKGIIFKNNSASPSCPPPNHVAQQRRQL